MKKCIMMVCAVAIAMASSSLHAGFISGVTKANGNDSYGAGGAPSLDWVPLSDTGLARNDRTHTLIEIPDELMEDNLSQPSEIAEMIQLSNSDKDSTDLNVQVSFWRLSALYVGIDNRQFGGAGGKTIQTSMYSWMNDLGFTGLPSQFINTGNLVGVDENNDGVANQYFTLFAALAPPGTYTLGPHEDGGNNMYVVIADDHLLTPVPEPMAMSLLGLGALGLLTLRRRRK